jgi:transcription initiation factor IIF auxiliary subunit
VTTTHNPPRTHDWKVYLRSADVNGDLSCLIQRCVFHLHPEFPNNKRGSNIFDKTKEKRYFYLELKSTPFAIQETGYAGFHLVIFIYLLIF